MKREDFLIKKMKVLSKKGSVVPCDCECKKWKVGELTCTCGKRMVHYIVDGNNEKDFKLITETY